MRKFIALSAVVLSLVAIPSAAAGWSWNDKSVPNPVPNPINTY